jgi:transposase
VLPAGARAAGWGSNPPNRGTFGQGTHTNTVERAIRPISLGRKNSLFAGSDGGARWWAIVASLVATAKLNGVEPLAWLTDVLERMVSGRAKAHELERLLPWAWKAERAGADLKAAT